MRMLRLILIPAILSLQCTSLHGQTPRPTSNQQVIHESWTFREGAPEDINALAQSSDGFLWLGTPRGLYRFDGTRFESFHSPFGDQLFSRNVGALFAPASGGLWIGYNTGGFSFLNNGHLTNYGDEPAGSSKNVRMFAQDKDGIVWAAAYNGLFRFEHSRWERIGIEWNVSLVNVYRVAFDRDAMLWVIGDGKLLYLRLGSKQFQVVRENLDTKGFTLDADGMVVTSPAEDLRASNPGGNSNDRLPAYPVLRKDSICMVDRAGSLWISEGQGDKPLIRLPSSEQSSIALNEAAVSNPETHNVLPYDVMMVDREGNAWFGDGTGLHRFFYSPLVKQELPPNRGVFAIAADEHGGVWVGGDPYIYYVSNEKPAPRLKINKGMQCLYRAPDGTFWFGGQGGLWHLVGRNSVQIALPRELDDQQFNIQAITLDVHGGLWASFGRGGFYRLADGVWTSRGGREDLPNMSPVSEFTDSLGRVWFGYPNNDNTTLAVLDGDQVQTFGPHDGLQVGTVRTIYGRGAEIWVGGEFGLQQFDHGRFHNITALNDESLRGISGLVETDDGDVWTNGLYGVFHIRRAEISEALKNPAYQVKGEHFGRREGLPGFATQVRPLPTAIEGSDGRLWFAGTNGVAWLDPAHVQKKVPPTPVSIQSVSADDKNYELGIPLSFPAHTSSVQINYSAVSLSDPEAIRFRYKLQETDKDWHEVGTASPVTYRNLSPGSYHFIVAASDTNGLWSDRVANVDFTILPAFYQTRWFLLLCTAFGLFVVWVIYNMRVRQIARTISVRFDERLAERTRIARELHDTLLQTVQGSKLVADDALEKSDDALHTRRALERLSGWLGQATQEGRAALNSLRTSTIETNDLAAGLRRATEECLLGRNMAVKFSVTGGPRDMHPIARDEIYRIGYEAIRNACEHSSASGLNVSLNYAQNLTLRVNDNGIGIETAILAEGKEGHFGLQGMRERAERIGSKLTFVSSSKSGTEMTLVVPGNVIFRKARATRFERIKTFLGLRDGTSDYD